MTLPAFSLRTSPLALLLGVSLFATTLQTASAQTAYTISAINGGFVNLISFDLANPGNFTTRQLSGAASRIGGLTFRSSDGLLYGFNQLGDTIVTIDPNTGVTTLVAVSRAFLTGPYVGIDFNPVTDQLRVIDEFTAGNVRVNPSNGSIVQDPYLRFDAADVNRFQRPLVVGLAHTNSDTNPLTGTQLYYIDNFTHALATTADPNSGVLTTVATLSGTTGANGFNIYTGANGVSTGYILSVYGNLPALYTINLQTGATSLVGTINSTNLIGLAIRPAAAPSVAAPEPGSIALLLTASVPMVGSVRHRKRLA